MSGVCDRCDERRETCICGQRGFEAGFEVMEPGEGGWSEWIHPLPGYLMKCCDCGLVHEMETAIAEAHEDARPTAEGEDEGHLVLFRMRRAEGTER